MSLLTKVGSFTVPSGNSNQAITGVGFQPKALILWGSNGSTSGTWAGEAVASVGFATSSSNMMCAGAASGDGLTTSSSGRFMRNDAMYSTFFRSTGYNGWLTLVSMDSDGFTYGIPDDMPGFVVNYLALGGTDITNAKVVNWTTPTTATSKAVTGVGFSPDLVLHAMDATTPALPFSAQYAIFGLGAMNKHGQQWFSTFGSAHGVNPSNTSRWQQTDAALGYVTGSETTGIQTHFTSMDSDGFTVNLSAADGFASQVISLCVQGVSSKIGTLSKTGTGAPTSQSVTHVGFTPKAILFNGFNKEASSSPVNNAQWNLGASDGTNHRAIGLADTDAGSPTTARSVFFNDSAYISNGNGSTTRSKASVSSLDVDGFTLTYSVNDSFADEELYIALGDSGVNTFPTKVA